jgi:hypothetical protein
MSWSRLTISLGLGIFMLASLSTLNAWHGHRSTLMRTIPLAGTPFAIVVDARTGRALISAAVPGDPSRSEVLLLDPASGQLTRGRLPSTDPAVRAVEDRAIAIGIAGVTPQSSLSDSPRHALYILNQPSSLDRSTLDGPGSLTVRDTRSGAVRETVPLGLGPRDMALDTRVGRLLVLNSGGTALARDPAAWLPGWLRSYLPSSRPALYQEPGSVMVLDLSQL